MADCEARSVIIVDDSDGDFLLLSEYLELEAAGQYQCRHLTGFAQFAELLGQDSISPDIVLIDCESPDGLGLKNLRTAVDLLPTVPVIGMSGQLLGDTARGALETGVTHFISKVDLTPARLAQTLALACASERRLRNLFERAHYDALTGLANRNLLSDRTHHALERCQRSGDHAALLMIDLDDFKQVNDSFGHDVGDAYLREIARLLEHAVRDSDTVARLGGDEFAILVEGLRHAEGAIQIATKLLELTTESLSISGISIGPSMSIGISLFSPESSRFTTEWLTKAADTALYRAKALGKNQYCVFTDELDQQMVDNLQLDHAIRRGLDRSELLLHYQPIVAPESHQVVALEALLRWQHPDRGMLGPGAFLPAIEKLGFMTQVGKFVVREALRQFASWETFRHGGVMIHINVSAAQLAGNGFAEFVAGEIAATGILPQRICLELTESVLFDHSPTLLREIAMLNELGVRFAIDDFGTGYGSYNYLRAFPISCIKIDKSFVDALTNDATNRAIVRSILSMAEELGVGVTAEGVETVEQLRQLRRMGPANLQGYLFHRPLPALEVAQLSAAAATDSETASVTSISPVGAAV